MNEKVGIHENPTVTPSRPAAPATPGKKTTFYSDNSSGLHFQMSAKSKEKISHRDVASQLSERTNGQTDVNIYDDRSQVTNNWLERKFSEIM